MIFGAYINGRFFQCVAERPDQAQIRLWRQAHASMLLVGNRAVELSDVQPFRVTRAS